jgi:hypothetical protein
MPCYEEDTGSGQLVPDLPEAESLSTGQLVWSVPYPMMEVPRTYDCVGVLSEKW